MAPGNDVEVVRSVPKVECVVLGRCYMQLALHFQGPSVGVVRLQDVVKLTIAPVVFTDPLQMAVAMVQHDISDTVRLVRY